MRAALLIFVVLVGGFGCVESSDEDSSSRVELELAFSARVGDDPFACGRELRGFGTSAVDAEALDLRLYVHDVQLLREEADPVAFEMVPDGVWQSDRVALLDFEDASGRCSGGTAETHTRLHGVAPPGSYVGVSFRVGVPPEQNHLDLASAAAPLDVPGMYWSWQGGYKYLKAEVATAQHADGYLFHLGSAGCAGSPTSGYDCADRNVAQITLKGNLEQPVTLDVKQLFAAVDLESVPDRDTDLVPGCMSSATDPECAPMLATLGLPRGEQRVFGVR